MATPSGTSRPWPAWDRPRELAAYTLALTLTPKLFLAMAAGAVASFPVLPALATALDRPGAVGRIWALARFSTLAAVFFLSACFLAAGSYNPFIYFRF